MVQDKSGVIQIIKNHKVQILSYGVNKLGLFGSFVRNEESDIDLYVEFNDGMKNFDNFINLAFMLEESLGRKVELVTKEALSRHFGHKILEEIENVPFAD